MADTKISQLPSATTPLSGAELVPLVQSGATVQTPTNEISKLTAATANTFTANQIISVTDNTNAALRVTQLGTGLALRIEDSTNPDGNPVVVDASGNVGIGDPAPSYKLEVLDAFDGNKVISSFNNINNVSTATAASIDLVADQSWVRFTTTRDGVGTSAALTISPTVAGTPTDRLRIDTSGNILNVSSGGLGYGTGSGGAVTQITSKGTNVTLNKTNGAITTNNSALGAGATATFTVFSTSMASTDTVILNVTNGNYSVRIFNNAAGSFAIALKNETAGSLSDAVQINFAIIKAVTS